MPTSCAAFGCTNRHTKDSSLQYFSFPLKNPTLLAEWTHAISRKNWVPTKHSRICSAHFRPPDYLDRPGIQVPRLKENAVPSVFHGFPKHLRRNKTERKPPKMRHNTPLQEMSSRPRHFFTMNSHHDFEQFDIKYEGSPQPIAEIKIEPQIIKTEIKTEAEESDDFTKHFDDSHIPSDFLSIKTTSEVVETPSLEKVLENCNKKNTEEDAANLVSELHDPYGTNVPEMSSDKDKHIMYPCNSTEEHANTFMGENYFEQNNSSVYTLSVDKDLKCLICNQHFNISNGHFIVQTLTQSNDNTFICNNCSLSLGNECLAEKLNLSRHTAISAPFKCNFCSKSFCHKKNLIMHIRIHTKEKPYKCNFCLKSFSQKSSITLHKRRHTNEKPFKCSFCSKSFCGKSNLIVHTRTHTNEKPYKCKFCFKSFSDTGGLVTHIRTHTNEKPFKCDLCIKTFSQKASLTLHKRRHTNEKPFKCNFCSKCFSGNANLVVHTRTHTNEKPYKCNICFKSFGENGSLTVHMRTHSKEKPFECEFCFKLFSHKGSLNRHIKTHTNKKPFACNYCSKSFSEKSYLIDHLRTHTNDKPFTCNVCNKSFSTKTSLRRHSHVHKFDKSFK